MTTTYRIEDLRPLYEVLIEDITVQINKLRDKIDKDLYNALAWNGNQLIDLAVEHRWMTSMLEACESLAKENDGAVDRNKLEELIRLKVLTLARNDGWSSNNLTAHMRKSELALLAKAMDLFGGDLLKPFQKLDRDREMKEFKAKQRAALWMVAKGARFVGHDGKMTNSANRAKVWSYEDRPALQPGQSYVMLETTA